MIFDYIDGGADDEVTMGENERAFREMAFRPRMGVGRLQPRLGTAVLGTPLSLPVILAPCGLISVMHPEGGAGIARAAARAGTVSVLSTVAGTPPEEVAAATPGPKWFQLYAPGRGDADQLIGRAAAAGFEGLVITIDTPALGNRERDVRNGVVPPLRINARTAIHLAPQVLARPRWGLRVVGHRFRQRSLRQTPSAAQSSLPVQTRRAPSGPDPRSRVLSMLVSPFTWDDIQWARDRWSGPLIVKGILSADDARRAADAGANAVVVSNHGGRQLDSAPATMRVLPGVVDAVADRIEVLVDGGVRRGSDVVKALAVGARAVLIGRAYLYGLAAGGEAGVGRILQILETEMVRTLALLGCPSVSDLDRSWLEPAGREPARAGTGRGR